MTVSAGDVIFRARDDVPFDRLGDAYREWVVESVIAKDAWSEGHFEAILSSDVGRLCVDVDNLDDALERRDSGEWVPAMYDGEADDGSPEWVPHPENEGAIDPLYFELREAPTTPSDLSFERVGGDGSRSEVNEFLEGGDGGLVEHDLGGVDSWKTAFVARYDGDIVSVVVLHHYNPSHNGVEISITRVANHPIAPKNTSTWVIGRARRWAERTGYERISTFLNVDENSGTCYEAAGFERVGDAIEADGKDWSGDAETWKKQKFVDELDPSTYADKGEAWATETVETAEP